MDDDAKRAVIACPQCGHEIATVPADDFPKGELVCPGCGRKVEAPGQPEEWIEEAKGKVKGFVEELIDPSKKRTDRD